MLAINADEHPLFKYMHRPDLKRPIGKQDKCTVVIVPEAQYEEWLDAPANRAMAIMNQCPAGRLRCARGQASLHKGTLALPRNTVVAIHG